MWKKLIDRIFYRHKTAKKTDIYLDIKKRMDEEMISNKLFRDSALTLFSLAQDLGTNRTYASNALKKCDISSKVYINSFRMEHALRLLCDVRLEKIDPLDDDEIGMLSGYSGRRVMNINFIRYLGVTYTQIKAMDVEEIEKLSTFAVQKYNYGGRKDNFFNEWRGENYPSQ